MNEQGLVLKIESGHFCVNDKCRQKLETSPIQLDEREDIVIDHNLLLCNFSGNPEPRQKNLIYLNLAITDNYFGTSESLPIKCPICNKRYEIKREDYLALKKETQKN